MSEVANMTSQGAVTAKTDYLRALLEAYYPRHFFAVFRAHELHNVEPFIDRLADPILDLGCGDGLIVKLLFQRKLEYGMDLSEKAIQRAKQSGYYQTVFHGDAHHMPLEDNSLGGVFSNCVLEHISDMPGQIAEVSRVLRPGGVFVATCLTPQYYDLNPVFHSLDNSGSQWLRQRMIEAENKLHHHVSVYSVEDYRRFFEQTGMELEAHQYYAPPELLNVTHRWDTPSKYLLPPPFPITHHGWLIWYLYARYGWRPRPDVIDQFYSEYEKLVYHRDLETQVGAAQILVARKR
ncbi:MAG: methyltransferase domain-containing protein [Anaerolineae bacterium]|nr:methyltransferase domain-containing protein [Anaerolineae bacterium]